jgi:hypothetical protein
MIEKKIYCFASEYFSYIDDLNYIPVGLGDRSFPNNWVRENTGKNISHKNSYYDMYTFHYWLWKNHLENIKDKTWIGFCTYRRFWKKNREEKNTNLQSFKENILNEIPDEWKDYDVILPEKLYFKKLKKIKIIKNSPKFLLKNPSYIFSNKDHSINTHFEIFQGENLLKRSLKYLENDEKKDFEEYLNKNYFYPWNLFFCKSKIILDKYYSSVFSWLFKCENEFGFTLLKGYQTKRIYSYLAERYLSYWFEKYSKFTTWPILFLDKDTQLKLKN